MYKAWWCMNEVRYIGMYDHTQTTFQTTFLLPFIQFQFHSFACFRPFQTSTGTPRPQHTQHLGSLRPHLHHCGPWLCCGHCWFKTHQERPRRNCWADITHRRKLTERNHRAEDTEQSMRWASQVVMKWLLDTMFWNPASILTHSWMNSEYAQNRCAALSADFQVFSE